MFPTFSSVRIQGLVCLAIMTVCQLGSAQDSRAVPGASEFGATLLETPCRVINHSGNKLLFTPPGLDRPILAINSNTPGQSGSAIFVDYLSGESTVVPMPVGSGGWDIIEVAPGKLLFESLWPLSLVTIDTTGSDYRVESAVEVPGNQYAWQFAQGPDGRIYFGSYPGAILSRYDPTTGEIADLGKIGPEENLYLRFVAFDEASGYLICSTGITHRQIVAYDVESGEQTSVANLYPNAMHAAHGVVYAVISGSLMRFDASRMAMVNVTHPAPPQGRTWKSIAKSNTPGQLLLQASDNSWHSVSQEGEATPVWDLDLRGGGLVAIDDREKIIGLRGQDYFVSAPLASEIDWRPIAERPAPVSMHFVTADPHGGVTGGPTFGQTLFRFDPARQLEQNTGQVTDRGGEVYAGLWLDDRFYFVAYAGGNLGVWDPAQPWDQWNNRNPRTIAAYNTAEHGSLIRPIGGMVKGPGGRFYTGWSAAYGKAGGGLTEFDPVTEKSRSWTNDRFAEAMSIGRITADDRYIYGVTSNLFSGIRPPNKPIVFWVFDPHTEEVVFRHEINGRPFRVPGTGHIWLANAQGLLRFDPATLEFHQPLSWPRPIGSPRSIGSAIARDSHAWIAADNYVLKLEDGETPRLSVLFQAEHPPHLAAGYDNRLYFTQGAELWSAPLQQ
jgi:hypothetical protein